MSITGISAGTAVAVLTLNSSPFSEGLRSAGQQLRTFADSNNTSQQRINALGGAMTTVGVGMMKNFTLPIVGAGAAAIKTAADFEEGMDKVSAISGSTGEDLEKLSNKAKEMGAKTKFSATEASDALSYMAMAGWKTNDMLDGLEGIMNLAAASGEELAMVSDIVTDALTAFGMSAKDSAQFADLLAAASSNSNTNVGLLGESFKYVAPVAGALGVSAKDTALALGLMANAGIKGSQSGTALRTALTNLVKPSKKMKGAMDELNISIVDSNGQVKEGKVLFDELREKFSGLTNAQKASSAATIFGKEAMSGMLAIINASEADYNKLTTALDNSNGSAKKMSETMIGNLKGSITILKSALEGALISIGERLIPMLQSLAKNINGLVDRFNSLSDSQKDLVVKIGLIVAAIGPALLIGGKLIALGGSLIGVFTTVSGAIAVVTTGAAAATPAVGALATAFTVLTGPVGIAIAGIGALTAGGIALYKHLNKEVIPEVKLFGKETSESTKKAVSAYMDLDTKASQSLMNLDITSAKVTSETANTLINTFSEMGSQIKNGIDDDFKESYTSMQGFFMNSSALTDEEEAKILETMKTKSEEKKKVVTEQEKAIKAIMDKASKEKRRLTADELEEIRMYQDDMKINAVKTLSETEVESKAILERMKQQAGNITAQQAAEVVKNSLEQKNKAIENADKQYNDTVKAIIKQRDEIGAISADQATKLIADAKKQRDETVVHAENMHTKVVSEAKIQAKDHVEQVDWETGQIKTKWQQMKSDISSKATEIKSDISNKWAQIKSDTIDKWNEIKAYPGKKLDEMKTSIKTKLEGVKSDIVSIASKIKTSIQSAFDIKLPHFSITTGNKEILGKNITYPTGFDVKWYDKGGIFDRPSIIGVGEKRPEFVGALDDLRYLIRDELNKISNNSNGKDSGLTVNIENFNNNREQDIEAFAYELEFYRQRVSLAKGG